MVDTQRLKFHNMQIARTILLFFTYILLYNKLFQWKNNMQQ